MGSKKNEARSNSVQGVVEQECQRQTFHMDSVRLGPVSSIIALLAISAAPA